MDRREGTGERKVNMGRWGKDTSREYRKKMENKEIRDSEGKDADTCLEKLRELTERIKTEVRPREEWDGIERG